MCIYIYIYIERERERYTCIHIYIYIYIHTGGPPAAASQARAGGARAGLRGAAR